MSKEAKSLSFSYAYDISSFSPDGKPAPCEGRFEGWIDYGEGNKFDFLKVVYDDLASQPILKSECQDGSQSDGKGPCNELYYQPWTNVSVPIPSVVAGSRSNLEFYIISDRGDNNNCNSALYLDNVTIQ